MPEQAQGPDSNRGDPASDAQWMRLVAEWFEEQAALAVAELERD